jgi:hypothetical protein
MDVGVITEYGGSVSQPTISEQSALWEPERRKIIADPF